MKNNKNIVIITLLIVILVMAVGYTAFATQLTINGTVEIVGIWDVKIKNVEARYVTEGCDPGDIQFTNTSVAFNAKLVKPGDYITYLITIENAGTIDATLEQISFTCNEEGSPAIEYEDSNLPPVLDVGDVVSLLVKISYVDDTSELPEIKTKTITGIIEYVQKQ